MAMLSKFKRAHIKGRSGKKNSRQRIYRCRNAKRIVDMYIDGLTHEEI